VRNERDGLGSDICAVGYAVLIMPASDQTRDASTADELLRRIESVTDVTLAHLSVEDLLVELLERVQGLLGVDTAAVLLLDASCEYLVATAAKGIEAEVRQGVRIPLGRGFAGRIAADKQPVVLEHVDHTNVLNPILQQRGIQSLLGVPLLSSGDVIGVLHVGTLGNRRFTDDDVRLLQIVADRVGFAVQSRRVEIERAAATVLEVSYASVGETSSETQPSTLLVAEWIGRKRSAARVRSSRASSKKSSSPERPIAVFSRIAAS